ncbi:MAG: hypothetical protein K9N23_08540 [Akkermansiaceae bacterium]|nr:hypothetical protein [Akkermansiaceae bacterium]
MSDSRHIVPTWVLIGAAAFAFVAVADLPYGYYRLLRWVTCAVAVGSAIQLHRTGRDAWAWALGAVAVLFNPFVPVHFGKETWRVLDAATGAVFLVVLYFARKDCRTQQAAARQAERTP